MKKPVRTGWGIIVTGIAFVGTGFVADYYITTLRNHPALTLVGVHDRDPAQQKRFASYYNTPTYPNLDALLADPDVSIVVNLTSPESHAAVSRQALIAGKHVYSEKPMAMHYDDAAALVQLAEDRGLCLASAPANALSASYKAVAKALSDDAIGQPRLIYAEMEDGPVFRERWANWRSPSGAPWPGIHEFEVGCTLEHAAYALSWLVALCGPVESLTAFSALCFPDKGQPAGVPLGPDFSVGLLNFRSGVVARLTSGLTAPKDRSLTILGDAGTITVDDLWNHHSPARLEQTAAGRRISEKIAGRIERRLGRTLPLRPKPGTALPIAAAGKLTLPNFPSQIDFCAGIAAQAEAIKRQSRPFFSGAVSLHITELVLALSNAGRDAAPYILRSTFSGDFPAIAPAHAG
ncbi:Gfo/Idh/MocA family oxidoreductase [Tianweitania sp. BSSL-BM11]|uniref:Gfo/Idh/MocA family oxidoreductase n=1 Tax=Tianweitania aestuarii TaxID=2814886 RepID=A0ABS5RVN8_9HYPH|nr:Gfo/Idh/MocA family oxidoreductase [Tianweitania aestuarii]MBS9721119.1 Gfo/Idh/MocA family oxidoreductase [Tianweitania aestuarii]